MNLSERLGVEDEHIDGASGSPQVSAVTELDVFAVLDGRLPEHLQLVEQDVVQLHLLLECHEDLEAFTRAARKEGE